MRPLAGNNGRSGSPLPTGHRKIGAGVLDMVDGTAAAISTTHAHGGPPMEFFLCSEDELNGKSDGDVEGREDEGGKGDGDGYDSMYGVKSLADAVGAAFDGGEMREEDRREKNNGSVGIDIAGAGAGNTATASTPDTTAAASTTTATAASPVRRVLRDFLGVYTLPSTPTHFDVSLPTSTLPGSPKSVSVASMRSSIDDDDDDDDGDAASGEDYDKGYGNGRPAVSDRGEGEKKVDRKVVDREDGVEIPQFIMPRIMIPRRRLFAKSSRALCKGAVGKEAIASSSSENRLFDGIGSSLSTIPSWAIDFRRSVQNERQRSNTFLNEINLPINGCDGWDDNTKTDHITEPCPSPESSWAMISTSLLYNNHFKKPPDGLVSDSTCTSTNVDSPKTFRNQHYHSPSFHPTLLISDQITQNALYHQQRQHGDDPLGLCLLRNRLIRISKNVLKILGGVGVVGVVVVALANILASSSSSSSSSPASSKSTSSRFPCSFSIPGGEETLRYGIDSSGRPFSPASSSSFHPSTSYYTTTASTPGGSFPSIYPMQRPGSGAGSTKEMSLAELVGAEILERTGGIGGIWDFLAGGMGW